MACETTTVAAERGWYALVEELQISHKGSFVGDDAIVEW